MNEMLEKTNTYRILRVVLNIGLWVLIGISAAYLILWIIAALIPQLFTQAVASTNLVFSGFRITSSAPEQGALNPAYIIGVLVMMAAGIICVWLLRSIVNSIRNGSPFTAENVKRIRIIGWVLFAQAYLHELTNYLFARSLYDAAFQSGASPVLVPYFTWLPDGVFLALCVLVLAEIFRYGCILQHEHDTTV